MKKIIHKADSRGHSLYNWLDSKHTFSFDQYFDPERVHFGALRVLNDDKVAPGEGFGMHPHANMEIISIPLKGELRHGDSHRNDRVVSPGLIQTMSAGTGIYHSEMNNSKEEPVEFLQIWVIPEKKNIEPAYNDYDIRDILRRNELALIVAPDGSAPAKMTQDTWFSIGEFDAGKTIEYKMHGPDMGVYIFLIEGKIKVDDVELSRRDGLGISETDSFKIDIVENSHVLLMEVPMR